MATTPMPRAMMATMPRPNSQFRLLPDVAPAGFPEPLLAATRATFLADEDDAMGGHASGPDPPGRIRLRAGSGGDQLGEEVLVGGRHAGGRRPSLHETAAR